ncbi:hypothetical protein ABK040_010242 [Willaertia magna]
MSTQETKVLVVGATGLLGSLIVKALLEKPNVKVVALIRKGSESKAENLKQKGVELISGDLNDSEEVLQKVCENVDVVLSAVIGTADTIVDGQLRLLQAAKKSGVKRFIPSDFAADIFKAEVGDNDFFDLRKKVAEEVKNSGVGYTFFLNGIFTEVLFRNFIDIKNNQINYYGDADTLIGATTYEDAARYVVEAALDPDQLNRTVCVSGSTMSLNQISQVYEQITGQKLLLNRKGSLSDIKELIEDIKNKNPNNVWNYIILQYQYVLFKGLCKLDNLQNGKYPQIKPTTIEQWLEQNKDSLLNL